MRRLFNRRFYLCLCIVGPSNHADIAVTPGLTSQPFYEIIAINALLLREDAMELTLGEPRSPEVTYNMDIASRYEIRNISCFYIAVPNGTYTQ